MTASDLTETILATLMRRLGRTKRHWRTALGPVRVYDLATHPHCNWSVSPTGDSGQVAAIEAMLDDIRAAHPIVTAG